jgi:hypothetical protein
MTMPWISTSLTGQCLGGCLIALAALLTVTPAEQAGKAPKPGGAEDPSPKSAAPAAKTGEPAAVKKSVAPLSPETIALRDAVRRTLAAASARPMNTRDNSVTDVLDLCLAFGCNAEVQHGGQTVNAITCLCWNYPCAGQEPLVLAEGHIAARTGYGLQTHRSQMLAVLAQSRVAKDYPIRVDQDVRQVSDLVEHEKLTCRSGVDMSLKLVGLAWYVEEGASWKNNLGETWSVERVVKEELAGPIVGAPDGGVQRLMGLSCIVQARKQAADGPLRHARQYVGQYHDHALKCQNPDGSWHPDFFASVGTSRDTAGVLRSTGHILEWLAFSLPAERLEDAGVVRAVVMTNFLLSNRRDPGSTSGLSPLETATVMHALRALAIYDERVFCPRDAKEPPPEEPGPPATSRAPEPQGTSSP